MKKRGFTLVEIMIVVAIIGILVAIAVPGFLKAREKAQQNACLEAQEKMEGAVDNWALDEGKTTGDQANASDIIGYSLYLKEQPTCPLDQNNVTYSNGEVDEGPDPIVIPEVGQPAACPNDAHFTTGTA